MTSIIDDSHFPQTLAHPLHPLTHAVGIALPNNEVLLLVGKGAILPIRRRINLRSPDTIHRGAVGEQINLILVEGEDDRADRNRLIGCLCFPSEEIKQDLPVDTEIEITIQIDASLTVTCNVFIPLLNQEFEKTLKLEKKLIDMEGLRQEFEQEKRRLTESRDKALTLGEAAYQQILTPHLQAQNLLRRIKKALAMARGDIIEADRTQTLLLELKNSIDAVENILEWSVLITKTQAKIKEGRQVIGQYGAVEAKIKLAHLEGETNTAISRKDIDQVKRKVEEIETLISQVLVELPDFWVYMFNKFETRKAEIKDQALAEQLIFLGRRAIQGNDLPHLIATVQQLIPLLEIPRIPEIFTDYG